MEKEILRQNHFISWGAIVGLVTLIFLSISIFYIDFDYFRHPNVIKDDHLKIFLIALSVIFAGVLVNVVISMLAIRLNNRYFTNFKLIKELGVYDESNSQLSTGEKKYDHYVLLLHGFTASPQEFNKLISKLDEAGIPYFAPLMTGFGQNSTLLLQNTRHEDWFRLALTYYDFLASISKKVSVVGHSMGGILATYIAQNRAVHRLVLSAPGLYIPKRDQKYKTLLLTPILSTIVMSLVPYLPKPIRPGRKTISDTLKDADGQLAFCYMAVPVRSGREVFLAQSKIDVTKIKNCKLLVLYGDHDETVDMKKCLHALAESNVTFTTRRLKKTAHNVFEDFDTDESCDYTLDFLIAKHIYSTYEKWPDV